MLLQCPLRSFNSCKESLCALWDKKRMCCGFITQPPINAEDLIYWVQNKLGELDERRHD